MAYKQDGFAHFLEFIKLVVTLCLEKNISHGKRFIHNQNFRFNIDCHRKGKPDKHTGRISFYRLMHKLSDICKIQYILQFFINLFLGKPNHGSVQIDVFQTGIFHVEPCAEFQQSRNPSVYGHIPFGGIKYPGDNFQNRGFSGAVGTDNPHRLPLLYGKRHIL